MPRVPSSKESFQKSVARMRSTKPKAKQFVAAYDTVTKMSGKVKKAKKGY